ncbi:hypothetical protein AJ85_18565 [Alkalihalobacillus alcalophilus ATCC 27647 = CGMCC 1.3604]|uniref:Uncharacterized protein n=1 Tax=Alkalihalobacillus alcalophilus ATCC 27647 = CGMCC 1.3604 TaxID=1218173 RepID=A0A094WQ05_ALKAL|nr:hypothetical protein [Alkalihalobacillus alcalophilus]KGA98118.1 hypothetical protein BALCAV_0206225 [Alkalihalobacillus alcalophilus ATCC 27647 = CGMCC 1.3604]MED1561458.1 hypothetical protein [Alkalihalobacillus alcalophilus]THG89301.1 hypothetical protein AJ85_18565 [Alkalihalobacillus alcalophilus ATCC 27647 = CGMCC 1.3604]
MSIDYRFNEWRVSGEQAEAWSPMAYRLCSKNSKTDLMNGYRVGDILYLHYLRGMTAKDIKQYSLGYGVSTAIIKSVLNGFGRQSGAEAKEAYQIGMYLVENEPEMLEKMYQIKVSQL